MSPLTASCCFVGYPDPKTDKRIWARMSVATGKVTQVLPFEGHFAFPRFMPSGDAVAYIETH